MSSPNKPQNHQATAAQAPTNEAAGPQQQTQLANPPQGQIQMVKCKTKYPIRLTRNNPKNGKEEDVHVAADKSVDLTPEEADEYCDRKFDLGIRDAFGNSDPSVVKNKVITRAERV